MPNVHFFEVADSKGDIYQWGLQGDKINAIRYISSLERTGQVRIPQYKGSKPADIHCTGKRQLPYDLVSVFCKYSRTLQTIRQ